MKKCPVCGWDVKDAGVAAIVDGKHVIVCCEECATEAHKSSKQDASR